MHPRLVAVAGPFTGQTFPITGTDLSVGRDRSNTICLDDLAVSRRHAVITTDGREVRITDLGSRNRITVNGVPVRERALEDGDQIRIGRSVFVLGVDAGTSPAAPNPAIVVDEAPPAAHTVVLDRRDARYVEPSRIVEACSRPGGPARSLTCLLQISEAVASARGLDALAGRVLEVAGAAIGAERGAILLTEPGHDECTQQIPWRSTAPRIPIRVPQSVLRRVLRDHVSICGNDVPAGGIVTPSPSVIASKATSIIAVPIVLSGQVLGAMYLDTTDRAVHFDEDHLQLLTGLAAMAAGGLDAARRLDGMTRDHQRLKAEVDLQHDLVGESTCMQQVYNLVAKVAPTDSTVLIAGESGTGKELVARAVHRNSPRAARPFVALNCAMLGEALLESELFGHEKGAFTGAIVQKKGKLEEAHGGTVFLDEIGELAMGIQARLLRVVQQREFERVGGTRSIRADIRLIAATNRDLKEEVKRGAFRPDLFYRLNVVAMTMPPLRERPEDVPRLVSHFLVKHAGKAARRVTGCSPEALACLQRYDWPGNVRELENAVERALVLGSAPLILPDDLPECIHEADTGRNEPGTKFHERIRDIKKQLVLDALEQADDNYTEAARLLGLHPNNLHRLMRNLRLRPATS